MRSITLILVLLMFSSSLVSQQLTYKLDAQKPDANYYQIVQQTRAQLAEMDMTKLSNQKAKKHFERWAYYWRDRVYADGSFPPENLGYFNAGILDKNGKLAINESNKRQANPLSWVNIGAQDVPEHNGYPNYPQMGRLNCLLRFADPNNMAQDILFVGAPTGGIWKSTDGGNTWTAVLDHVAGIGITDIASAASTYSNNTVIYASTGDYDAEQIKSIGVLKSTDGGATFQSTGLSFDLGDQEITSNLIVLDDDTVIVGTVDKIYKTVDGGATWQVKLQSQWGDQYGRFVRDGNRIACIGIYGDVYLSNDRGETWTSIKSGGMYIDKNVLLMEGGNIILIDMNGQIKYYFQNQWNNIGNPVPNYDAQGGYNQTLIIEGNMILTGAVEGYHSTNVGSTWYNSLNGYWGDSNDPGTYAHSDYHAMGMLDNDTNTYKYWVCNDGGLSYVEYSSLNTLKPTVTYKSAGCLVTQLYSVAITPNLNTGNMIYGNQDNDGFSREMHNGSMQWIAAAAGDGTATAIDYTNPKIRYLGSTEGGLIIATNGFSHNYQGDIQIKVPGANFVWPLEMSTVNHNKLFAGGGDVYLLDASGNGSMTNLNAGTGTVSFISTHNNVVCAIGDNAIKKSLNNGQNWSGINEANNDPNTTMNSIDFDGNNPSIMYCTVRGYENGKKVYKSTDGGQTWTNISAGLPNILMKEVLFAQNAPHEVLYVATELGVYYRIGNSNWSKLGGNTLPNVIVNDIDINYTENTLVAATFGRGLWQIDISSQIVGLEESQAGDLQKPHVYPNPANNLIHIDFSRNTKDNYQFLIYNVVGGLVKEGDLPLQNNRLDISDLPDGAYMIRVFNAQHSFTQKIVKN